MNLVLLLDANLSWRLIRLLENHFEQVFHVDSCGLDVPAKDTEIWAWAKQKDAVIVTNDEDFCHLLVAKGFPPKIVLLRMGNLSTQSVAQVLIEHKSDIVDLYKSIDLGLLEIV